MGSSSNKPIEIVIIGAGIAGLCAGISLARAGHKDVTIYEKSSFKNEIGAAISITPNGNRILSKWGFDYVAAGETDKTQYRGVNLVTMEQMQHTDLRHVKEIYGEKFNAFHRVDLHRELRRLAGTQGVRIELGHEVVDLECEDGVVRFKGGKEVKVDLVVAADGLRSSFIQTITNLDIYPKKIGKSVFRGLMPISRLESDPIIYAFFKNQGSGFFSGMNHSTGVMAITYPCSNDEIMNIAIFHTTRPGHEDDEGWSSPATVEEVLSVLEGMHDFWPTLIKKGNDEDFKCFPITFRDAIPNYHRGRVILIGDAAHPMQPTHAQGGGVSIEDAASLEVLLPSSTTSFDVPSLCQLYNDFRIPRDNTTQLYSNAMFYKSEGSPEAMKQFEGKLREVYPVEAGELMTFVQKPWDLPHQRFWYGFDAHKEARKARAWWEKEGRADGKKRLPAGVVRQFWNMFDQEGRPVVDG